MTQDRDNAAYPQRRPSLPKGLDALAWRLRGHLVRRLGTRRKTLERFAHEVKRLGDEMSGLEIGDLRREARQIGDRMRRRGFRPDLSARCFAIVREVSRQTLGMVHYGVQIMGGRVILEGKVAEMATGEGKTLTAVLPACAAALAGIPVHVVSVNDYLTARDAEGMGPVYKALGLSVGVVNHGLDPARRKAAYACDVTYCTNKELVFDFLRDRVTLGPRSRRGQLAAERLYHPRPRVGELLMRGLHFAIIDEADSIFIDEAKTPVILSAARRAETQGKLYREALALAEKLKEGVDYRVDHRERKVVLGKLGLERLEVLAEQMDGFWAGPRRREELVTDALAARCLFKRDRHYVVEDGKVVIVDEYTGRLMPDRSWSQGLHQAIEAKEDCEITAVPETLAQISFQRFLRLYLRLAGMTGTAREVSAELWAVYRLSVAPIPTHLPDQRRYLPGRLFLTAEEKWREVVRRIQEVREQGRPLLIGTSTVADSELLSALMSAQGLDHRILNARQDQDEAQIIAQAGTARRITVATNMAGRGTDIVLPKGVAQKGGLHVIATQRHDAGRIDRQLFGRCARQGDPGSCEAILSLEDDLLKRYLPAPQRFLSRILQGRERPLPSWMAFLFWKMAQKSAERAHRRLRAEVLRLGEKLQSAMGFTGMRD